MTNPRQAEATGTTATFTFRKLKLTVPLGYANYPLGFIEAMGDGASPAIQLRELLGTEQWAKVRAMNLKGADVDELVKAADEALGTDAGEEPPSSN